MAKFKCKNGGICEVYSTENINKLRKNPDYKELVETKAEEKNKMRKNVKKEIKK